MTVLLGIVAGVIATPLDAAALGQRERATRRIAVRRVMAAVRIVEHRHQRCGGICTQHLHREVNLEPAVVGTRVRAPTAECFEVRDHRRGIRMDAIRRADILVPRRLRGEARQRFGAREARRDRAEEHARNRRNTDVHRPASRNDGRWNLHRRRSRNSDAVTGSDPDKRAHPGIGFRGQASAVWVDGPAARRTGHRTKRKAAPLGGSGAAPSKWQPGGGVHFGPGGSPGPSARRPFTPQGVPSKPSE